VPVRGDAMGEGTVDLHEHEAFSLNSKPQQSLPEFAYD